MIRRNTMCRWAVCFVLAALFLFAVSVKAHADVTEYDLWIAGTQVTSENAGDLTAIDGVNVAAEGEARYVPETNTLILNNAAIKRTSGKPQGEFGECYSFGIFTSGSEKLTINVGGQSSVCGAPFESTTNWYHGGIWAQNCDLEIVLAGGAGLDITVQEQVVSASYGIFCYKDVTITGPASGTATAQITSNAADLYETEESNGIKVYGTLSVKNNATVNVSSIHTGCQIFGKYVNM
ncbi:MAG: hypothetical protein IIY88_02760, partial [Eubacterium sp.]|nr:hypothetical protein [Eubacterium sp.]